MNKEKRFIFLGTVVGLLMVVGLMVVGLYTMGYDVIHCTGTQPCVVNGVDTVDYLYTPILHKELHTYHLDKYNSDLYTFYVYNLNTHRIIEIKDIKDIKIFLVVLIIIVNILIIFKIKNVNKIK